jgi:hypothetical protein
MSNVRVGDCKTGQPLQTFITFSKKNILGQVCRQFTFINKIIRKKNLLAGQYVKDMLD